MGCKILIPQDITKAGKDFLKDKGYKIKVLEDSSMDSICREVGDCDALLVRTALYPRKIMEAGKQLKVIARYGAGVDNIDIDAASEYGVQVCNAPIANSNSVAEHAIALLLACAKNLKVQDKETRKGNFESRNILKSMEVSGKILGLVGCGHIGQMVAQKAHYGLHMNVKAYDTYISQSKLPSYIQLVDQIDEIFETCDFISLHIPITEDTRDSVNRNLLNKMKPNSVLINCSRGGVVNEADLYEVLSRGRIKAAGIDVFEKEPVSMENPLLQLENVIVSPHNAALTYEAMDQMGIDAAKGIDEVLSGKTPTWPVNRLR